MDTNIIIMCVNEYIDINNKGGKTKSEVNSISRGYS